MPNKPRTHQPFAMPTAPTHEARPNAHRRGYTRRWQQYRLVYLHQNPLCASAGCNRPATDVDHVRPVAGPDDPAFWDECNHQALCHQHHSAKTASEDRGRGRAVRHGGGG